MGFLSTLFGGGQAKAAKKAAGIQAATARENRDLATSYTGTSIADLDTALSGALGELNTGQAAALAPQQPYQEAGQSALAKLLNALGLGGAGGNANALESFQAGPGYGFAMDQGVNALDRSAAARGNLYSGAQGKALTTFGQGLANQEWGNWLTRLSGLISGGQSAAGNSSNILSQFAQNRANALLGTGQNKGNVRMQGLGAINDANAQIGAANAGGVINAANARSSALSNIMNLVGTLGGAFLGKPTTTNFLRAA